jgi:hypothetical protein
MELSKIFFRSNSVGELQQKYRGFIIPHICFAFQVDMEAFVLQQVAELQL